MRLIPDEALDLIAGGYSDIPIVTIIGPRPGGGGGSTGGGYGDATAPATTWQEGAGNNEAPPRHSSPPPPNSPAGVSMDQMRYVADRVGDWIRMLDNKVEHGALLIKYADGSLGASKIASGDDGKVRMGGDLAPGDKIVGYIHSHTYDDVIDQRLPSQHDFTEAAALRQNPRADPHLLLYILDMKTNAVYEYHSGQGPSTNRPGPDITHDVIKP